MAMLQAIPQATELLSLLQSTQRDEPAICDCAKRLCILCPQAAAAVAGLSLSPEEIIHKWDSNRDEAARAGTWMHFTFEALAAPDMCTHKGNPFRNYGVLLTQFSVGSNPPFILACPALPHPAPRVQ